MQFWESPASPATETTPEIPVLPNPVLRSGNRSLPHARPALKPGRVGRIARAHGNRGQVIVTPDTDFPETRFQPGAELFDPATGHWTAASQMLVTRGNPSAKVMVIEATEER